MSRLRCRQYLNESDKKEIVKKYQLLERMTDIAHKYRVSRQRIFQILKAKGVDTSKKGGMEVICTQCKKEFKRHRCQVRKRLHCFCSLDCYYDWLAERRSNYKRLRWPYLR